MPEKSKTVKTLEEVNLILGTALPTIGLLVGAVQLTRELFRRREAGETSISLDEAAQLLTSGGDDIITKADAWLAEHGYDTDGNKV